MKTYWILSFVLCGGVILGAIGCDETRPKARYDSIIDQGDDSVDDLSGLDGLSPRADLGGASDMGEVDVGPPRLRPRFKLEGGGFYDTPWPSDARRTPEGTPELSDFPTNYGPFLRILNTIEERVMGFANMPVIYVAFDDPISGVNLPTPAESLAVDSPIQLLALGDQCGRRIPIESRVSAEGDSYTPAETLQVKNTVGTRLETGRPYALVILRSFGAELEREMTPSTDFLEAWRDERVDDESPWANALAPLRECLSQVDLSAESVAIATVFTPQDPVRSLRAMRDVVMDPERVETRAPESVGRDVAWSRRRLALTTYSGLIPFPVFQRGETPYRSAGGGLVYEDGIPLIQRWEPVPFAIAMRDFPEEAPFVGERPALVFIDGTGWTPWSHLYSRWLSEALDAGFIIFSFMPQFHGERAGVMGGPEVPTFNFFNPESGRMNFQQQAVETSFFVRVIREQLSGLDVLPALDVSRIVYGGHSQGAVAGALNAAVESEYAGYVFNGLSSYLTFTILERKDLLDFELLVRGLLNSEDPLDLFSPALQMMQLGSESVDPHNFAPLWRGSAHNPRGNHVFVINGYNDETTTPRGMDHLTLTASLPVFDPPGWEIDPLNVATPTYVQPPLAGNELSFAGAPLTLATYLDPTGGHGTVYRNPILRQMTIRFWETALSESSPRLEPDRELMCADGADGDRDGMSDCDDPDCVDREPCLELSCEDGQDNDNDGAIDCDDLDCIAESLCQESECADGEDNDADELIDCDDPSCATREPCAERLCGDGEDGDADGLIDCDDPDCESRQRCHEVNCQDEVDNNDNGLIDCEDSECLDALSCPEPDCADETDEDGNGRADCADPRCFGADPCLTLIETNCEDTVDDDQDGLIDCEDPDCVLNCSPTACADGDLGERTGIAVFRGTLEGAEDTKPPGDCTSLGSGRDTPDLTLRWTAPVDGIYELSTLGSEADTVLTLYSDDCEVTTEFACHDDQLGDSSSAIRLQVSGGQAVRVVISAYKAEDVAPVVLHILSE